MAAHESPRTTKLYDRTGDEITLEEVDRIKSQFLRFHGSCDFGSLDATKAAKNPIPSLAMLHDMWKHILRRTAINGHRKILQVCPGENSKVVVIPALNNAGAMQSPQSLCDATQVVPRYWVIKPEIPRSSRLDIMASGPQQARRSGVQCADSSRATARAAVDRGRSKIVHGQRR